MKSAEIESKKVTKEQKTKTTSLMKLKIINTQITEEKRKPKYIQENESTNKKHPRYIIPRPP